MDAHDYVSSCALLADRTVGYFHAKGENRVGRMHKSRPVLLSSGDHLLHASKCSVSLAGLVAKIIWISRC